MIDLDASLERAAALDEPALARPWLCRDRPMDVHYALYRTLEHTIQCEKTLTAIGWQPTEGRRIARALAARAGEVEGLGGVMEAREIERRLAERVASGTAA